VSFIVNKRDAILTQGPVIMPVDRHSTPKNLHPIDRLLYLCNMGGFYMLTGLTGLLGRTRTLQLGRLLGRMLYAVAGRLRRKILLNLDLAFRTTLTPTQKKHIARKSLAHFCANGGEVFFATGRRLTKSMQTINIESKEHLEKALAHGHGVIAVSAHMGTYPLIGPRLSTEGYTSLTVVRDLESPVGSAMYARLRELIELPAIPTVPEKKFFKAALGLLRSGGILYIITDENKRHGGVFVDFFGRNASTAPGPTVLARRTGAAIVPMFIVRNPDNTQTIHIHEAIFCAHTDNEQRDIREATAAFTLNIEQQIRQDPAQWPWNNWRWRTQPHGKDESAKIHKKNLLKSAQKFLSRRRS
jgi:KDO2-lipid IV(A) lauroyltransferase